MRVGVMRIDQVFRAHAGGTTGSASACSMKKSPSRWPECCSDSYMAATAGGCHEFLWTHVTCCLVVTLLIVGLVGCKKEEAPSWLVKEYETPAWAGEPGLLLVRTEAEGSKVLLVRRRPFGEGLGELFDGASEEPKTESEEAIYRYDPDTYADMFAAVGLREWEQATGTVWWDVQQERRVPSRMHVSLSSKKLSFGKHPVPIKGDAILHMARSMHPGSKSISVLTAKRKYIIPDNRPSEEYERAGWIDDDSEGESAGSEEYSEGTNGMVQPQQGVRYKLIFENFYHQAYDTEKLDIAGSPVPLPFTSDDDAPKCIWAGEDTYVVCTDSLFKRVLIIHRDRLLEEGW